MCSCKLETEEKYSWINNCDSYDRVRDIAVWTCGRADRSVRYNILTAECGLFEWNFKSRRWVMEKELPVKVHDPISIKQLAERVLK